MEKNAELSRNTHCLNCGVPIKGAFCHQCGQRARDNLDRSLGRLLGEFFGNVFFLDNRFFLSLWFLIRFPGRMTIEFLDGKRKKFISPVTLYLFFNLIYFFVNPLTDYSISLYDQINSQPYSHWVKEWAETRLQEKGVTVQTFSATYQNASDNISKSIMIINIPMIALFIYLIVFKQRKFYFDSLIFAFHFFSFFMFSWISVYWIGELIELMLGTDDSIFSALVFIAFTFLVPLLYAVLAIKKFMSISWYWAIPAGLGVTISVFLVNLCYRLIVFLVTFWSI